MAQQAPPALRGAPLNRCSILCAVLLNDLALMLGAIGCSQANAAQRTATLEEVVVFARKREENAQQIPMSVSVRSGAELDVRDAVGVREIVEGLPNISLDTLTPRQTSLVIRGLGKNPANDGLESSVGVFLDGVYLGRPGMVVTDLVDLERVEVLRGPQGTLFGKNVTAGAVNVLSRGPTPTRQGYLDTTLGENDLIRIKAAASGPIAEEVDFRLTAFVSTQDGFTRNSLDRQDLGENDRYGGRAQLQWRTPSGVNLRAIADYSAFDEDAPAVVLVDPGLVLEDGSIRPDNFLDRTARAGYTPTFDPEARRTALDGTQRLAGEQSGASLQADWRVGQHTLTSLSSWRAWNFRPQTDGDITPLDIQPQVGFATRHRQATQELRLTSPLGQRFDYVGGAYVYLHRITGEFVSRYGADAAQFVSPSLDPAALNGFVVHTTGEPQMESYALFAQGVLHLSPRLDLTMGVRWTAEHKRARIERTSSGGEPLRPEDAGAIALREQLGGARTSDARFSDDFLSGLLNVSYAFTNDVIGYASLSQGAKSGGINSAIVPPGVEQTVEPEIATSAEVGVRSEWLDGRLRVNVAAFRMEVDDYQSTVRDPVRAASLLANAESVRSEGLELETLWQATPQLQVGASAGWADARYTSFRNATCPPEAVGRTICDATGSRLPGAPPWTASATFSYAAPLGASMQMYVMSDAVYTAAYRNEPSRYTTIDAYTLVNARIGVRDATRRWDVSLWSRNVLDEFYYTALTTGGVFNSGVAYGLTGDPRTFGLSIRLSYH